MSRSWWVFGHPVQPADLCNLLVMPDFASFATGDVSKETDRERKTAVKSGQLIRLVCSELIERNHGSGQGDGRNRALREVSGSLLLPPKFFHILRSDCWAKLRLHNSECQLQVSTPALF